MLLGKARMAVQDLRETRQVGRREDLGLPCKTLQSGTRTDDIPAAPTTALTGALFFFKLIHLYFHPVHWLVLVKVTSLESSEKREPHSRKCPHQTSLEASLQDII